tara:strand:+ start:7495 stop:9438 length:1944 start_codon:yes stop_codon:yes gene_type:complete
MSFNFSHFLKSVITLPRITKRIIALVSDALLCVFALWISFYLRIGEFISLSVMSENSENIITAALLSISIALPIFWLVGLYRTIFRYSGKAALINIVLALGIYGLTYFLVITIYSFKGVPRTLGIVQPLVLFFLVCGSRLFVIYIFGYDPNKINKSSLPRTLIYGAGNAGRQLVAALESNSEMKVIGFLDDDVSLHGQLILGKDIFPTNELKNLIISREVTHVLLAMPSINRGKRSEILNKINQHKVIVRTLPSVSDLVEGKVTVSDIRDLDVVDILGREIVAPNSELLSKNIKSKVVLVTGAGGSIGSEICRQVFKLNPKKIIMVDISEYALYKISSELDDLKNKKVKIDELQVFSFLASVQDENRISQIIKKYKPDTVYHAAAYKHVPLVEENICEGVKNNVFGTLNILQISIKEKVSDFVLISSDKAVRPSNVMGASKRISELCLQAIHNSRNNLETKLCMVRFGNVLGSSGSIIPKFKKQIKDGGPVTLTHPEVTRYFMAITEAAQLVIQAGAIAEGADVFVLEMGEPIKIIDLIKRIVLLSGLSLQDEDNIDGDIKIKTVGLRPGEKLYEELMLGKNPQPTSHPKIYKAKDPYIEWVKLEKDLKNLKNLLDKGQIKEVIKILQILVTDYKFNNKIVDTLYNE